MSIPLSPADLQKPDLLRGQRREWAVERFGWLLMALLLVAGSLGLFGGGPLAHSSRAADGVRLEFDRLVRHGVPTELRLSAGSPLAEGGKLRVALDWRFLKAFNIRDIRPTPISSASTGDHLDFEFAAAGGGENYIVFELEPLDAGIRPGEIVVGGETAVEFRQIVFP